MKNSRGNLILIVLVFLLSVSSVMGEEYTWSASINKKEAYVNEAIYVKYTCTFVDRSELYVIEFSPKSNELFDIISLSQTEMIKDLQRINTYEFIVFAKKSGRLDLNFDVAMKKTNKDSIENTVLGRDNAQFEEFSITKLLLEKLSIKIKDAQEKLVGDFKIEVKQDDTKIKAYEPYHMQVSIMGIGDLERLEDLHFDEVDAEVFASKAEKKYALTKEGYKGTWSQKFAFVSDKDFVIPRVEIKYLNLSDEKVKTLELKQTNVVVSKLYEKKELLDEIDEDKFEFKREYFYYLLTFIAGFLAAKVSLKTKKETLQKNTFFDKVNKAKTLDEVLILLLVHDSTKYRSLIKDIENKKLNTISDVKKQLNI